MAPTSPMTSGRSYAPLWTRVPESRQTMHALASRTGLLDRSSLGCFATLKSATPLATHDVDAKLGTRVWWATPAASDAMDYDA